MSHVLAAAHHAERKHGVPVSECFVNFVNFVNSMSHVLAAAHYAERKHGVQVSGSGL